MFMYCSFKHARLRARFGVVVKQKATEYVAAPIANATMALLVGLVTEWLVRLKTK